MANRRPIRNKLLLGAVVVGFVVAVLSASSFLGLYSYRRLVRAVSCRAAELPSASRLEDTIQAIRLSHARDPGDCDGARFQSQLADASAALTKYLEDLAAGELDDVPFADRSHEQETAAAIGEELDSLKRLLSSEDRRGEDEPDAARLELIEHHLDGLVERAAKLPTFLQQKLHLLAGEVRTGYRSLIVTAWTSAIAAAVLLSTLAVLTYRWVFRPLKLLAHGSRRVASGDFDYRLSLDTHDEMAELAAALNGMTERFQAIRDDLDNQVQLRTREVIRSEQLASVGFLAAGVAHEINNPLASIAMCAESLEGRLGTLRLEDDDLKVAGRYLELNTLALFPCLREMSCLMQFAILKPS